MGAAGDTARFIVSAVFFSHHEAHKERKGRSFVSFALFAVRSMMDFSHREGHKERKGKGWNYFFRGANLT
jgi:hypothetical protein